jgi:hypothetical protein
LHCDITIKILTGAAPCFRSSTILALYGDASDLAALYYIDVMEASAAAMEISAIGTKSVSKLLAQR